MTAIDLNLRSRLMPPSGVDTVTGRENKKCFTVQLGRLEGIWNPESVLGDKADSLWLLLPQGPESCCYKQ